MTVFALNHVVAQMERGVKSSRPLIPPQILAEDLPLYVTFLPYDELSYNSLFLCSTLSAAETVFEGRNATENILRGVDDRLIVVVGYALSQSRLTFHSDIAPSARAP